MGGSAFGMMCGLGIPPFPPFSLILVLGILVLMLSLIIILGVLHDNMVRSIGLYGRNLKLPSMHELSSWIIKEEVQTTSKIVDEIKQVFHCFQMVGHI